MRYRSLLISVLALLGLAFSASAAVAASPRAVVYSKSTTIGGEVKGGLFAVKSGHLNQITEDPADTEPAFSGDGRTIAFVRGGDLYSIRPDGSGQRQLTSGADARLGAGRLAGRQAGRLRAPCHKRGRGGPLLGPGSGRRPARPDQRPRRRPSTPTSRRTAGRSSSSATAGPPPTRRGPLLDPAERRGPSPV